MIALKKKEEKRKKASRGGRGGRKTKPRGTDIHFGKVAPKTSMPVFNTSQNLLSLVRMRVPSKQHQTQDSVQLKKKQKKKKRVTTMLLSMISRQNLLLYVSFRNRFFFRNRTLLSKKTPHSLSNVNERAQVKPNCNAPAPALRLRLRPKLAFNTVGITKHTDRPQRQL